MKCILVSPTEDCLFPESRFRRGFSLCFQLLYIYLSSLRPPLVSGLDGGGPGASRPVYLPGIWKLLFTRHGSPSICSLSLSLSLSFFLLSISFSRKPFPAGVLVVVSTPLYSSIFLATPTGYVIWRGRPGHRSASARWASDLDTPVRKYTGCREYEKQTDS